MDAQNIINEVTQEIRKEEILEQESKARANQFKREFYPTVVLQEEANLNLSQVVGK